MTRASTELELLSAYLDGQLDAQDTARIEQLFAADPAARARLDALKISNALARQALEPLPPVSDALRNSVQAAVQRARTQARPARKAPSPRFSLLQWLGIDGSPRFAFAASTVVAMVGVLGFAVGARMFAAPESGGAFSVLVAGPDVAGALTRALSETASGKKTPMPRDAVFEATASFRDGAGSLCREFRVTHATDAGAQAVACRGPQGWSVSFATAIAGSGAVYTPAASPTAALDAYVQSIGGGAPLSADEEAKALAPK